MRRSSNRFAQLMATKQKARPTQRSVRRAGVACDVPLAKAIHSPQQSVCGERVRGNQRGRRVAATRRCHDRRTDDGGTWHDGGLRRSRNVSRLAGIDAVIERARLRRVVATTLWRATGVARSTTVHAVTTTTEAAADRRHCEGQASQYKCDLLGHEDSFVFEPVRTGIVRGDDRQIGLQPVGEPACLMGRPSKRRGYSSAAEMREEQFSRKLSRTGKLAHVQARSTRHRVPCVTAQVRVPRGLRSSASSLLRSPLPIVVDRTARRREPLGTRS